MPSATRFPSPDTQGLATGLADLKMSDLPGPHPRFAPYTEVYDSPQNLTNRELWRLWYFEEHAESCSSCHDPYAVHRRDGRLCAQGHQLAVAVADIIYSKHDARAVYYRHAASGDRAVTVQIPTGYDEVHSLLRAMERSLRHRRKAPIVSYDAHYYVPERPIRRSSTLRTSRAPSPRYEPLRGVSDARRSNIALVQPIEGLVAESGRRPDNLPKTNYAPPSVEDDVEDVPVPTARTERPKPRPHSTYTPASVETTAQDSRPEPVRGSPDKTQRTPSPLHRQATGPPPTVLPAAPEPPVRSDRPAPTDFSYHTSLRQPPSSHRQPSSASRRRTWLG